MKTKCLQTTDCEDMGQQQEGQVQNHTIIGV